MERFLILCFFGLLLLPNLLSFLSPDDGGGMEKRTLAEWPSITWENYEDAPAQIEDYINDHAPFRSEILDAYSAVNWTVFGSADSSDVIVGTNGWLFYTGEDSVADVLGLPLFTEEELAGILEKLLRLRQQCAKQPEDFVLFIAPNKEQIYREYLPDAYRPAPASCAAQELTDYIRAHSDIRVIWPTEALKCAKEDTLLYYKMDTHWNRAGGYTGTAELLRALGGDPPRLDELEKKWGTDVFRGDLADLAHLPDRYVEDRWLDIEGYPAAADDETAISLPLARCAAAGAPDPRKLVMIRDSFGENMMPWLMGYFQESTFIHVNLLPDTDAADYDGDILVYEVVERSLSGLDRNLAVLLEKTADPVQR